MQYESNVIVACEDFAEQEASEHLYQDAISVTHPCGREVVITYQDSVNRPLCGSTFTRAWTVFNTLYLSIAS